MPLERLYLETTIVSNLKWIMGDWTFADGFYDHKSEKFLDKEEREQRLLGDCIALRYLIDKDDEFGLQFIVSDLVREELVKTSNLEKRAILLELFDELASHFADNQREYLEDADLPPESLNLPSEEDLLVFPDEYDRRLLLDAVRRRCHVFLTFDYRTIIDIEPSRVDKERTSKLLHGLRILTPSEYLKSFRLTLSSENIANLPCGGPGATGAGR